MNEGILQSILSFFTQILNLASTIYIYNDNGIRVSVLSFFVALSILGIVLIALLNFIRFTPYNLSEGFKESSVRSKVRSRRLLRRYYKNAGK